MHYHHQTIIAFAPFDMNRLHGAWFPFKLKGYDMIHYNI